MPLKQQPMTLLIRCLPLEPALEEQLPWRFVVEMIDETGRSEPYGFTDLRTLYHFITTQLTEPDA